MQDEAMQDAPSTDPIDLLEWVRSEYLLIEVVRKQVWVRGTEPPFRDPVKEKFQREVLWADEDPPREGFTRFNYENSRIYYGPFFTDEQRTAFGYYAIKQELVPVEATNDDLLNAYEKARTSG